MAQKDDKADKANAAAARASAQAFVEQIRLYNEKEGLSPHEPLTYDALYHAALFVDGEPVEDEKTS